MIIKRSRFSHAKPNSPVFVKFIIDSMASNRKRPREEDTVTRQTKNTTPTPPSKKLAVNGQQGVSIDLISSGLEGDEIYDSALSEASDDDEEDSAGEDSSDVYTLKSRLHGMVG